MLRPAFVPNVDDARLADSDVASFGGSYERGEDVDLDLELIEMLAQVHGEVPPLPLRVPTTFGRVLPAAAGRWLPTGVSNDRSDGGTRPDPAPAPRQGRRRRTGLAAHHTSPLWRTTPMTPHRQEQSVAAGQDRPTTPTCEKTAFRDGQWRTVIADERMSDRAGFC